MKLLNIKPYILKIASSVAVVLLGTALSYGQATSNSPYSFFGLGDRISEGMIRNMSMGDTKYATYNAFHLNPANPASYASLKATSFNLAVNYQVNNLSSNAGSQRYDVAGMRYFGLGIPVSKRFGAALGLTPMTQLGYDISSTGTTDNETISTSYNGRGGLSRVFVGLGYELVSDTMQTLSIGTNLSYIFGPLEYTSLVSFPENTSAYRTFTNSRYNVSDLSADFGVQYKRDLARKAHLDRYVIIGASYKLGGDMRTRRREFASSLDGAIIKDTLIFSQDTGNIYVPARFGIGAGMEFYNRNTKRRLFVNAEFEYGAWSQMERFGENENLQDSWRTSFGLEFIPDDDAIRGMFKIMSYRAGFHYGKTYLNVNNQDIFDYGVTFGIGIPLVKSKSLYARSTSINIGYEFGERAYNNTGLISEQYSNLMIGVVLTPSFWDKWFQKRRIN